MLKKMHEPSEIVCSLDVQVCNVIIGVVVAIALVLHCLILCCIVVYCATFVASVYLFQLFIVLNVRDCCSVTSFFTIER